jgi:chromosome segregation ATPase
MPMGNNPRLYAVLRAGQSQLAATGAVEKLTGKAAADALLKKAPSADSVMANNPGAPPNLGKAQSTPAAPAGFQTRKGGGGARPVRVNSDTGNQILQKSSEVVKDLVDAYKQKATERAKTLEKARADAKSCSERRIKAVTDFQKEEAKAAEDVIKKLEEQLKKVEKARDDLQNASDDSLRKLGDLEKAGGETSKKVGELTKLIEQLKNEKASLKNELDAKIKSCNEERDLAAREAKAELEKLAAEWKLKLDECQKKAAAGDVESSKELKECTTNLEKALEDLEKETKAHNALEKSSSEAAAKFKAAAKAACDALKEFTQ